MTTRPISQSAYKKLQNLAKDNQETLAIVRRESLEQIKLNNRYSARENAIEAYLQAREFAYSATKDLANSHPEKAPNWSPNARRRHGFIAA